MTFRWVAGQSPREVWGRQEQVYVQRLEAVIWQQLLYYSVLIEAYMKTYAPWEDHTSNARQTLFSRVYKAPGRRHVLWLVACQKMEYGVYLELDHGGRFAIVMLTLQLHQREVWTSVKDAVE
jgi:hypothetical protein